MHWRLIILGIKVLYDIFPREVCHSENNRYVVYNKHDFLDVVNKYRMFDNIFSSVYSFDDVDTDGEVKYSSAFINKIYFDIDLADYENGDKMVYDLRKMNKLMNRYNRVFIFSGRGFHPYLLHESTIKIINKNSYVANIQYEIMKRTGVKIDGSCIGRLDKLARIIGSRNQKSRLFCISLKEEELRLSYKEICEIAKEQRTNIYVYKGEKYKYNEDFDFEIKSEYENLEFDINNDKIISIDKNKSLYENLRIFGIDIDNIPPCINYLLNTTEHGYQERTILILYLKHCGLTLEKTRSILKQVLDTSRYFHVTGEKIGFIEKRYRGRVEHQDTNLYKKDYYISCKQIRHSGICFFKRCDYKDILHNLT